MPFYAAKYDEGVGMMVNGSIGTVKRGLSLLIALFMLFGMVGSVTVAEETRGVPGYYLVGNMNGWAVNADYQLTENTEASVTEFMITLDLAADAEFKVVYSNDGSDRTTWFPGGSDNNYVISEAGNYTVYLRPDYNGDVDWHEGCLYAEKNEIPTYAVTIVTDGNGTATAEPAEAKEGDTVTVTITPNEGYLLDAVTGADDWTYDEASGTGTFTMPASPVTISVTFREEPAAPQYNITKRVTGEGTLDVPAKAAEGETVTFTATPAEGYTLRAVKVDGRDVTAEYMQSNSYSFTMPAYTVTIEAVFDEVQEGEYYIHVFVFGLGTAFADRTTAKPGDTVTITTEDNIGYVFSYIEVNGVGHGAGVKTFTMPNEDVTVNVIFERKAYAINLHSGVQGTMNAIPRNNEAYSDTTVQIVVNADEDYAIESLTVKSDTTGETIETTLKSQDGQTSIYEFTMPESDITVTATYHKRATNGYYLIGTHGWAVNSEDNINMIDGNDKFVDDLSVTGQMMLTIDLTAGQSFKVVHVTNGAITEWFPNGNNYTVDSDHAGSCVIYFRPDREGGSDWWEKDGDRCIYVKRLQNEYYLAAADSSEHVRTDDHLYINREFDAEALVPGQDKSIRELYNVHYEHMVLTWLNSGDKIKVVRVRGSEKDWLPGGMDNAYPQYIASTATQTQAYTGMVFVFFEEELVNFSGANCTGSVTGNQNRIDWTNNVFDVQKAYKADAAEKAEVNPLNAESLTYNLEHGSITLSTGTAFIREGRSDANGIPTETSNIIYELGLNQKVYVSVIAEAGYALDGTPYITYGSNTVNMTKDGDHRYYFTMPSADVVIHAPMRKVFRTQSVLLSGQIGVNFYVDLAGLDTSKCRMKFTIGKEGHTTESWDDFDPDHHSTVNPSNFGFTCFLNSIQMADDILAELYCGNERISYKHYSLQEYVIYFDRTDSTQDGNLAALRVIRAMIDFGYYAQQYFFKAKPGIADDYAEVERHYATQYDFATIKRMTESHSLMNADNLDVGSSDVKSLGLSIALDSATAIILYIGTETEAPEIKVGTGTLSLTNPEIVRSGFTWKLKETAAKNGGRRFELRIEGISPHNLDKVFTVKGTAGSKFTIKVSAFSYIDYILSLNSMDYLNEAKMMVASMYQFHEAEVTFRNSMN